MQEVTLFSGIGSDELEAMLTCVDATTISPQKGDILLYTGEKPEHVGIVLAGQLHIAQEDYDGNRTLLDAVTPGGIFAEALCCAGIEESPITVMADSNAVVLLMRFSRLLQTCSRSCSFHTRLIENMLRLIAKNNLHLQKKMEIVSLKAIRAKVIYYLESFIPKQGRMITIPFNREELANYLCVERSALSHELARMQKDGLIEYKKNVFTLK
ncbi:MAG: Crp/Fnr family transcriptional regulator [Peptococcaceae bacterium]|nr:Crp/Fnr family transcriptional regulator [Peptococcaceae bacterium]